MCVCGGGGGGWGAASILETPKSVFGNSADTDQTPPNPASGQGFHCLQII